MFFEIFDIIYEPIIIGYSLENLFDNWLAILARFKGWGVNQHSNWYP